MPDNTLHAASLLSDNSLGGSFEQSLHHAPLMVFQQGEVEAVLVGAAAAPTFIQGLHLHQRAMGVVENHKALRTVARKRGVSCCFRVNFYLFIRT